MCLYLFKYLYVYSYLNILMCVQGAAERIRLVGAAEAGAAEARGRAEETLFDDEMMISHHVECKD